MTIPEFRQSILSLIGKYQSIYKGTLEEYLRSILASISKFKSETPSYSLFTRIFEEGFEVDPLSFDEGWLSFTEPPQNPLLLSVWKAKSKYYGGAFPSPKSEIDQENLSEFESLRQTAQFQIAELHVFARKNPEEYGKYAEYVRKYKVLGLESSKDYIWYNWDPCSYLECGTAGLVDHSKFGVPEFEEGRSWAVLTFILEWGRTYE